MIRFVLAFVAILAVSAAPVFAQCNAANGQCGAPNSNSSVNAQAIQAALNGGLATSNVRTSASINSAPVAPQSPAIVYRAPVRAYAYAGNVNPNQVLLPMPGSAQNAISAAEVAQVMAALRAAKAAPAPEEVAQSNEPTAQEVADALAAIKSQSVFRFAADTQPAASSATAEASVEAQQAPLPIAVNPGLARSSLRTSGGCNGGSCNSRAVARSGAGVLGRVAQAIANRPRRQVSRASSRTVTRN